MPRSYRWISLAIVAVLLRPNSAPAQVAKPVLAVGQGEILKYDPLNGYSMRLRLRVRNVGNQPVTINRAEVLMVSQGELKVSLLMLKTP